MTDFIHNFDDAGYYTGTASRPLDPVSGEPAMPTPGIASVDPLPEFDAQTQRLRLVDGVITVEAIPIPEPEPEPEPAPDLPPSRCTRRQGRLALLAHGHLDDVESHIAGIVDEADRQIAQIEYEADTWERDNSFVHSMWQQLGGAPEQLDDLFRMAVTL